MKSVLVGEPKLSDNGKYFQQFLVNGDRVTWTINDPIDTSLGIDVNPDTGIGTASSEFDGWEDSSTYDEAGFFVKENGVIRFAKIAFADFENGELHAKAMVEIWNQYTDKTYELMGEGIGWAACKRGRNDVPPGVDLKEVCRFYYLDENLNSIHKG